MNRLAVFARMPSTGRVKTRLSPSLPADLSAQLYVAMLTDALEAAAASGSDQAAVFWAPSDGPAPGFLVPEGVAVRHQHGAGLGQRLSAAFGELLEDPVDRAVVIGSDCPDLGPTALREAFAALEEHDLVLGPARDGGYYLIGLRRVTIPLFEGVSWGTDRVFAQTCDRAKRAGLRIATLDVLGDIDGPEDLVRFVAERSVSPPGPGARTESALREMGLLPPRG